MLAEWQQLQAEVWDLDSRARHLEPAAHSAAEKLARHRQYHAEFAHALRQLRSTGGGSSSSRDVALSPWPHHFSGEAKALEEIFGQSSAQAWEAFFQALGRCPRAVPALAHAAGYQSYEVFAYVTRSLVDDALLFSMQDGAGLVCALDEVLDFEFEALAHEDTAWLVSSLLADGSFLAVLTQLFTSHSPSCMAWAEDAIGISVMEAIVEAVTATPGGDDMADGRQRSNFVAKHNSDSADSVGSNQGIETFIGEKIAPPGPFLGTVQSQRPTRSRATSDPKQASDVTALCHAAAVVVSSLCERAASAPMELCRLVAALCRQLSKRYSSEVADAAQTAFLGSLLLVRWLVPYLLKPGQLGHSLGFGLANAEPRLGAVLVRLAKLLKAIALDASQSAAGGSQEFCGASPEFVRQEAHKLRTGFFNTLRVHGGGAPSELSHTMAWPRCLVCTTTDLGIISQAIATQPALTEAATSEGISADALRAIGRLSQARGTPEAQVVFVWLQIGDIPTLPALMTDEAACEDRGSTGGTAAAEECGLFPEGSIKLGHKSTADTAPSLQGDAGGTSSIVNMCSAGTGAPGKSLSAGIGNELLTSGLEQLWNVLAEPHPLEGPPEASLLSALQARHARRFGWSLTQLLRLEMLEEWLRSHLASKSGGVSGLAGGQEPQLLNDFRRVVAARRTSVSHIQRLFYQLQIAQRLLEQHITEVSHALRHSARLASELRCSVYLQSLWNSSAGSARPNPRALEGDNCGACGSDGPLEFCMLSPPKQRSGGKISPQNKAKNRWVANLFGASSSTGPLSASASTVDAGELGRWPSCSSTASEPIGATGHVPIQASVQIFEVSRCPYHRIAAVSTTMGLDQLSLEQSVKHRTPRSLRQAILAFQQLPLELIVQGEDPLNIAGAIHTFIDLLAARLLTRCKAWDPKPALRSAAGFGSGYSGAAQGSRIDIEDRPRPADIICTDDRHISDYVAHYIFGHLHSRLFPHEPTDADLRMAERISRLAWLKPRHLDVPQVAFELAQVSDAIKLLRRLCRLRTPGEMLASLTSASRNVSEAACLRAQLNASRGRNARGGCDAFGADDLVPLFILVVLRANPPMFNSVLLYVERLTSRQQMLTEQGYTLTQLRAAVSFTESVKAADLEGLDPNEWERHMSSFHEPSH